MAQKADLTAQVPRLCRRLQAEYRRLARRQGEQPGQHAQQARLAGAVRTFHNQHLARADIQVDAGQERVEPGQGDGGTKTGSECRGLDHGRRQILVTRAVVIPWPATRGQHRGGDWKTTMRPHRPHR